MASATLRDYLQYTEDAISAGRIDDAQAQCQRILSHFPESLEAQRLLGEVYLAREQLEEAQQTFDWILVNDPENIVVYCDRALICERMSDYDTALDCYQQAYELSRGNSQIRHEFNKLSTRVGQQGFMLSRAGLARLYMRGDLLPQAILEWETVLAANPDRLDARIGLLETYWREGLFEQVEELANAILSDIPGCLKALLLFAHVTSLKDMQRAEELIRRAEMLDPELVMARELFSDLIANQPRDPFLQLLNEEPIVLPEPSSALSPASMPTQNTPAIANGSHEASPPPSNSLFSWSSLDTLIVDSQQSGQPEQDIPTFAWSSDSALDINPWSTIDQLAGNAAASAPAPETKATSPSEPELVAEYAAEPSSARTSPEENQIGELEADTFAAWNKPAMSESSAAPIESAWGTEAHEETALPAPPAWLDMLTKGGRSQSSSAPSGTSRGGNPDLSTPKPASTNPGTKPSGSLFPEPEPVTHAPWDDTLQTVPVSADNADEAFSFGPDWLKSLGAEVIENDTTSTPAPIEPAMGEEQYASAPSNEFDFWQGSAHAWSSTNQEEQEAPAHSWLDQLGDANWQTPIDPWKEQAVRPAQPTPSFQLSTETQQADINPWTQADRSGNGQSDLTGGSAPAAQSQQEPERPATEQSLATLETLERELFAQGFVQLEPGSLSSIAEGEALSSALAQFGSEVKPEPMPVQEASPAPQPVWTPPAQPAEQQSPESASVAQSVIPSSKPATEPLWLATPTPSHAPPTNPASDPRQESPAQIEVQAVVSQSVPPAAPVSPLAAVTSPTQIPSDVVSPERPAAANDFSLDELELTMRRPVVKLQPVTQKSTTPVRQTPAAPVSRNRPAATGGGGENTPGYKERLRKGYHHQLAGDYDEAMQEYRVIIRNAPELLSEVVSNMRALLKLAPRYAPGYRVLGDAYMRQGEYLQAMEAYNKALMMAKKGQAQGQAKGQGQR